MSKNKDKKENLSKIRFKGLCKVLLALVLTAPAPVALGVGISKWVDGVKTQKKIVTTFEQSDAGKQAIEERDKKLALLEEQKDNKTIGKREYNINKEYLNSNQYILDKMENNNPEYISAYGKASTREMAGMLTTLPGGFAGVALTAAFGFFGVYKNAVIGAKELATGKKKENDTNDEADDDEDLDKTDLTFVSLTKLGMQKVVAEGKDEATEAE